MLRLTGILTGSVLTIAAMVFMMGIPHLTKPAEDQTAAPEWYERVAAEPVVAAEPPQTAPDVNEFVPDSQPEPAPEPVVQYEETTAPDAVMTEPVVTEVVAVPEAMSGVQEAPESRWYAFWSPFRSEIAADGFVSELQRTTGLDYRVVKLKPGIYEVAFAYSNDADREQKLSRIAAATGLDVSGG